MQQLSAEKLKQMLDSQKDLHIVNVLSQEQFDRKHIPGSVSVPVQDERFPARVKELVNDKADPVVVYCASATCDASPKAAKKLESEGFTNVYDFQGGVEEWEEAEFQLAGSAS